LRVTSRKSSLYHEGAIAERFGRWIGDDAGITVGRAPKDDESDPDGHAPSPEQLVVIRVLRDNCLLSVDSSGFLLHRRGYRLATAKAPLRETLAAALIRLTGWQGETAALDPLCGSGTIPIESALIARNIPPGLARADRSPPDYAFLRWEKFDPDAWEGVLADAKAAIRDAATHPIVGSDRDEGAITAALENARRAGVEGDLQLEVRALSTVARLAPEGWLITNPPYGVRVGNTPPLRDLYAALGKLLSTRLSGWRLAMMSADAMLERSTGLDLVEVARTRNGGIPVRVMVGGGGESDPTHGVSSEESGSARDIAYRVFDAEILEPEVRPPGYHHG
jgi:putative N6-adenine-specific DNA methylase